jgi:tetratricopeptide (TPR) repeat protein
MGKRMKKALAITICLALTFFLSFIHNYNSYGSEEDPIISQYRKALELDPDNIKIQYQLGIVLLRAKLYRDALDQLLKVYVERPDDAELNYHLGLAYAKTGALADAFDAYMRVKDLDQERAKARYELDKAFYNLGLANQKKQGFEEALKAYEESIRIKPGQARAYCRKGELLFDLGNYDQAMRSLKICEGRSPEDQRIRQYIIATHQAKGLAFIRDKMNNEALIEFKKLIELAPENENANYFLGHLYYHMADYNKALEFIGMIHTPRSSQILENLPPLLQNIAIELQRREDWEEAGKALRQAIDLRRSDPNLHFMLGYNHMKMGNYKPAYKEMKEVLLLSPEHSKANLALAVVTEELIDQSIKQGEYYLSRGNYADALKEFNYLLQIDPQNQIAFEGKRMAEEGLEASILKAEEERKEKVARMLSEAERLLNEEKPREALIAFRSAIKLDPEHTEGLRGLEATEELLEERKNAHTLRGDQYIELENLYMALKEYKEALFYDPDDTRMQAKLKSTENNLASIVTPLLKEAKAYEKKGKLKESVATYNEVLVYDLENQVALDGRARTTKALEKEFQTYLSEGRKYSRQGDYLKAINNLNRAKELKPDDFTLREEIKNVSARVKKSVARKLKNAEIALKKERYSEAVTLYEEILSVDKRNQDALGGLKNAKDLRADEINRKTSLAKEAFNKGKYYRAYKLYGEVLAMNKGDKKAKKMMTDARKRLDKTTEPLIKKAVSAYNKGKINGAILDFKRVLNIDPTNQLAKRYLGKIDKTKARKAIEKEVERHYLSGIELYTDGKYLDAIKRWETVLELDPQHQKARLNIEKAKRKLEGVMDVK